jgi:hypothetical protein
MNSHTHATLEELEKVEWFYATGRKDTEAAVILSSWKEAISFCASNEWQDLLLEATNQYHEKLSNISRERSSQWNIILREVKTVTAPLVARKIERVVKENQLPKIFEDTVNWDIMNLAMEAEYSDICSPAFFASQAYWYTSGHFPCGWQGKFPEGRLIVY